MSVLSKSFAVLLCMAFLGCKSQKVPFYKEVYHDDFRVLNSRFWEKATHTFENNLAQFDADNLSFDEAGLALKVTARPQDGKKFSAAELRSIKPFRYGKFTIRMKASAANGVVSAFFLYSERSRINKEIDIEFTGKNTSVIHLNYWHGEQSHLESIALGFDAAKEFHDYSIIWLPDELRWEVDGKEIFRAAGNVPGVPLHLMLNVWPSKENAWAGKLSEDTLPTEARIQYVKVYAMY